MDILGQPFGRHAELDSRPAVLRREDAPVARHQGSHEFSKGLAVPAPDLIWETLDVRLFPPQAEVREPANKGALRNWPADTTEVYGKAFFYLETAHSRPRADEVRNAPLGNVAAWKLRPNDRLEIVNDHRIDVGE